MPKYTRSGHRKGIETLNSQYCGSIKCIDRGLQNLHSWVRIPPAPPDSHVPGCRINESFQIEPFLKNCSSTGTSAVSLPKNLALNSFLINHLEGQLAV